MAWYTLPKYVWPFNKVDDALGVVYTHGIAGLLGGLLVGLLADPKVIVYLGVGNGSSISGAACSTGTRTSCSSSSRPRSPSSSGTRPSRSSS